MKQIQLLLLFASLLATGVPASAIIVPGANGTDGALNITANTEIDLSLAPTAVWDSDNTANAGKGVYDPAKWAVVFKYTSVTVAAGATVTFKNHPSRAPVVWLVSGDVTINGTVSLDGQDAVLSTRSLAEPGPGGSRGGGGAYFYLTTFQGGAGFGISGGKHSSFSRDFRIHGGGGSYASIGIGGSQPFGNAPLLPLLGGSGGGGAGGNPDDSASVSGGGGGGGIQISCSGLTSISGLVRANGGNARWGGAGAGGGIRLVARTIAGNGQLQCYGGGAIGGQGGVGYIRVETTDLGGSLTVAPPASLVADLPLDFTAQVWPPAGAPEVRVVSVGGQNAVADPRAEFARNREDFTLPVTTTTQVIVETTNVEQTSQVRVRGTPRINPGSPNPETSYTVVNATVDSVVSADPLVVRWVATLPVGAGYTAVQAHVIRP